MTALDTCREHYRHRDRAAREWKHNGGQVVGYLCDNVPEELIRAALSETKYQNRMGRITKSRGAFFTDQLQRLARDRGIELRLVRTKAL